MSAYDAPLPRTAVRSTTETSAVGTRKDMPVSLPLSEGSTLPTALAAPVADGMMFCPAPRPPRQSFIEGPSTVFCVAVVACTVVIKPSSMPKFSSMILASGARQLVVHDALETMVSLVYLSWLTPITYMGASADGAEMKTTSAPPFWCAAAFSRVVKMPVDSTTALAPLAPQGMAVGSRSMEMVMGFPSMTSLPSLASTVPL